MQVVVIITAVLGILLLLFSAYIVWFSVGYTGKKGKMYRFAWKFIDKYLDN